MNFKLLAAAGAVALSMAAGAAQATVVNFDDLPGDGIVPNGYGGINWNGNWDYYLDAQDPYNPSSPDTRVYADYSLGCCSFAETNFYFSSPVTFNGAYFAGYYTATFNLYNSGSLVHTSSTISLSGTPTFLASGYAGAVDEVRVYGDRDYFVMDDVTYNGAAVPEPASWALMIGGFGLAGAALRRRRAVAATA